MLLQPFHTYNRDPLKHKVRIYKEYHSGPLAGMGLSQPLTGMQASVSHPPPPPFLGGGEQSLAKCYAFSPVVVIGTHPTPHTEASVPLPPVPGGRGTIPGEREIGGVPIPTTGEKA